MSHTNETNEIETAMTIDQDERNGATEKLEKRNELFKISKANYFLIIISLILYIADVLSDLFLGIKYLANHDWLFGSLVLFFVIGTSILYFFLKDSPMCWPENDSIFLKAARCMYLPLNVRLISQNFINFITVNKFLKSESSKDVVAQINEHKKFIVGYKKSSSLQHNHSIWETIPQIFIQIFILVSTCDLLRPLEKKNDVLNLVQSTYPNLTFINVKSTKYEQALCNCPSTVVFQLVTVTFSIISLMKTKFIQYRAIHLVGGERVTLPGLILMAFGYTVPIVCRAFAIAYLLSSSPFYAGIIFLLSRYTLSCLWWQKYGWEKKKFKHLVEGFAILIRPSLHTNLQCLAISVILFIEDVLYMLIWPGFDTLKDKWMIYVAVIVVEAFTRTVMVVYWWNREKFTRKVIQDT